MFVKRGMRQSKRAISPLIATVLLVAFAVAIGAMIMNWGKDVVSNVGDCSEAKLELQTINGKPLFCYDTLNRQIHVMVKNTGEADVEELKLRVIGADFSVHEADIENSKISIGSVTTHGVSFVKSGKFRVEIIPVIKYAGKERMCSDKALVVDDIPACKDYFLSI